MAKVIGRSMEPLISNGAYCLFQYRAPNIRNGTVGLFQLHNEEDPEFGGRFTVKRLQLSTQPDSDGGFQRMSILAPENPEFKPISVESDDIRFIAEFLEVLKPLTDVSVKAGERYLFQ